MSKKYKLTDETINLNGATLYRIEALKDFGEIKKGDKGGFIESEDNLSHEGNAWVYDNACVYDNARVYHNVSVSDYAQVYGNAIVYGDAIIEDYCVVRGNACIGGNVTLKKREDYVTFYEWWSIYNLTITWTRPNNMWRVGTFYGTAEELVKQAYEDHEKFGRQYEHFMKSIEAIIKEEDGEEI